MSRDFKQVEEKGVGAYNLGFRASLQVLSMRPTAVFGIQGSEFGVKPETQFPEAARCPRLEETQCPMIQATSLPVDKAPVTATLAMTGSS